MSQVPRQPCVRSTGYCHHKVEKNTLETLFSGVVKYERLKTVKNREDKWIVGSSGEIHITDKDTGCYAQLIRSVIHFVSF